MIKNMLHLKFKPIEPLKSNRFIINVNDNIIPNENFTEYSISNDGKDLIFKTKFYETVMFQFNPKNIYNIKLFEIEYLDPTGTVINTLTFNVKNIMYEIFQSYKSDELQTSMLSVKIDIDTIKLKK